MNFLQRWVTRILIMHSDRGARNPQKQETVTSTRNESRAPERPGGVQSPSLNYLPKDGHVQDLTAHVYQLRGQASSSRQRVEEAKASQAASTSQNKVLDSLTRLRNSGRVSGFHVSLIRNHPGRCSWY